jgi:hypothetical protein
MALSWLLVPDPIVIEQAQCSVKPLPPPSLPAEALRLVASTLARKKAKDGALR